MTKLADVWLPFAIEQLHATPASLRVVQVDLGSIQSGDPGLSAVRLLVLPYQLTPAALALISQMKSLEVVHTMTSGVDAVEPHVPEGVTLCNGAGIHEGIVAEHAMALTLATVRTLHTYHEQQTGRKWLRGNPGSIDQACALIVGNGGVADALEPRLMSFGAQVTRVGRRARKGVHGSEELLDLLPKADIVMLAVPLTSATRGLVDRAFLKKMKAGALLVNIARGEVVDTQALMDAAGSGHIIAALDVTHPEPLPQDHPLWSTPNIHITPHIAGGAPIMWQRTYRLVEDQLRRFAERTPLVNVVSRTKRGDVSNTTSSC